jgi:hypothetical protein
VSAALPGSRGDLDRRGGTSFAARYWRSLVSVEGAVGPAYVGAVRTAGFWRRFWVSLVGMAPPAGRQTSSRQRTDDVFGDRQVRGNRRAGVADAERSAWLRLPQVPSPAAVAAGDEDAVVLRTGSPDGTLDLLLHRSEDGPSYSLEVVLRAVDDLPVVVSVRYGADPDRVLLIPVTHSRFGPPSSAVRMLAFDPTQPWQAHVPARPADVTGWSGEAVGASIGAAATAATLQAWRDLLPHVPESVRAWITIRLT